ncbi:MAG TPA: helix-turn-helix domain-containing protein [Gammaproteobacteria bacterium]|nr:helix-turn-helix domain-containing protein [Gammaproteobacteria bacterium]
MGLATQSHICNPSEALRPFVDSYWSRAAFDDGRSMRLLPEASSYVIFELAGEIAGSAYMVGTLLRPVLVELRGEVDRVGIRFRPGMASVLLGLSASDFRDRVAGVSDASIPLPLSLIDELAGAADFQSRVGAIENWLLRQWAQLEPSALAAQTVTARLFRAVGGGAGPRDVAALTGWNERKTQRLFLERFGASAATLRRWSRFRRALAALEAADRPTRASVAARLGYSDQAHMCREFREFAGTDIGSLLAERRSVGNVQAAAQSAL